MTEAELSAWGRRIGAAVPRPVFIGLIGPIGAGKSVLARAVAEGAGVRGHLPSPTFNLVFRYEDRGGGAVIHADLYRIRSPDELAGIGWDDLVDDERAIVLVEWPGRAGPHLPDERWEVHLRHPDGADDLREVEVTAFGDPPRLPAFPVAVG